MKTKFRFLIICLIISISVNAQDYSVKGKINSDIYTFYRVGTWFFNINAAYGLAKQVDAGLYYKTHFYKEVNFNEFGIDARYYLTPFLFKKQGKFDLYACPLISLKILTLEKIFIR